MSLELVREFQTKLDARFDAMAERFDALQKQTDGIDAAVQLKARSGGHGSVDSPGSRLVKQVDLLNLAKQTGRCRIQLGQLQPDGLELKTLTSGGLGFSAGAIMPSDREPSIAPLARRRLVARDLLRSRGTSAGQVEFVRQTGTNPIASPQIEGLDKLEANPTFEAEVASVVTIAHWLAASRQVLDDLPELQRFIDQSLLYGLRVREELQVLFGDGSSGNLSGVSTEAGVYQHTYAASGDTKLDILRHAIQELADIDEECSAFVLNPRDVHDIELLKDEAGGSANTGRYIASDPVARQIVTAPTLWGRPVLVTNGISSGTFLCGDFSQAEIRDRQDATLDISTEHGEFFVKNLVALRMESRLALPIFRTTAFLRGSFSSPA
jgi:HK97 family phage major capsid protein